MEVRCSPEKISISLRSGWISGYVLVLHPMTRNVHPRGTVLGEEVDMSTESVGSILTSASDRSFVQKNDKRALKKSAQ